MRYVAIQVVLFSLLLVVAVGGSGPQLFARSVVLTVLGVLAIAVAAVLGVLGFLALGSAFRVAPEPRPDSPMVSHGVYRWFRHPMYTAVSALSLGAFCIRPTLFVGLLTVALCAFLVLKARHEEKLLFRRHTGYAAYARRTWGVVPFLRG